MVLYENLLAGIVHSMNNVVTLLGMSLELASTDDARGDIASLRSEVAQLEQLIALTATLASRSAREEALELREVLEIALTIHALNPSTRAVRCAVHVVGFIAPVRVPRPALLRVLLLMIDGAKQGDGAEAAPVRIDISGDADRVFVRAPFRGVPSRDAVAFAATCGGILAVQEGCVVFELPSLQRLRAKHTGQDVPRGDARPTRASGS